MPDLLKDFEHRSNNIDKLLLYFMTGRENDNCIETWSEDEDRMEAMKQPEF